MGSLPQTSYLADHLSGLQSLNIGVKELEADDSSEALVEIGKG
jgi:hypothetical protein